MNQYTTSNPPKRGTALRIWKAFKAAGLSIGKLHYNPNNFGRLKEDGYGTWAFTLDNSKEAWCGIFCNSVVVQQTTVPFTCVSVEDYARFPGVHDNE